MVAPDETTLDFVAQEKRPYAPKGAAMARLKEYAASLATDSDATFDRDETLDAGSLVPQVSWGTTPAMTVDIDGTVPEPKDAGEHRAQSYMGLTPGQRIGDLEVNTVFIGSCTNARLEDLEIAAKAAKGHRVAPGVRALVVPGSASVREQAEKMGLDTVFKEAGFEWHRAGCSMCLGMNGDILQPGQRSASTSNRPYEGRQGPGSRTHLVSPLTAVATAIRGKISDPRDLAS